MTVTRSIASAALLACALASGCASNADKQSSARPAPRLGLNVDRSASIDGVELRWWAANDAAGAVGSAIASVMETDRVLPPDLQSLWEESGLRFARVPRASIETLLRAAPPVTQFSRDWKGWMGEWLPVFKGVEIPRAVPFTIAAQRHMLGPGAPRVLMRAWPAPTALGAVVRIDLAFQFIDESATPPGPAGGLVPTRTTSVRAGEIITALTAELALDPAAVYVITSETPGVAWRPPTGAAGTADSAPSLPTAPQGPGAGDALTLGELLFSFSLADRAQRRKVIVLIVPELSGGYQLLPANNQ